MSAINCRSAPATHTPAPARTSRVQQRRAGHHEAQRLGLDRAVHRVRPRPQPGYAARFSTPSPRTCRQHQQGCHPPMTISNDAAIPLTPRPVSRQFVAGWSSAWALVSGRTRGVVHGAGMDFACRLAAVPVDMAGRNARAAEVRPAFDACHPQSIEASHPHQSVPTKRLPVSVRLLNVMVSLGPGRPATIIHPEPCGRAPRTRENHPTRQPATPTGPVGSATLRTAPACCLLHHAPRHQRRRGGH